MDGLIAKAKTTTNPKLYLEFFKSYYKEKTKTLTTVTTIIGAAAVLFGIYAAGMSLNLFTISIPLAVGLMLIIYPRFSYRRPYNSVKNNTITTRFEFYDDRLVEINDASRDEYYYASLLKIHETDDYFYIYHNKENASVVDKKNITIASVDELRNLLKKKITYANKG